MSDLESEPRRIALAGREWDLSPLPFRLLKKVQPRLLSRAREIGDSAAAALRLDEETLDDLAECVWIAIWHVDSAMTRDAFFELPFTALELLGTMPAVLAACGLGLRQSSERTAGEAPEAALEKK